jgi:CO/xanthine dehydrogenase FAD-binding subunit
MPITVKTYASLGEAASALQSDRTARFLAGGTLVMRALNEGDTSISTLVRSIDRDFTEIGLASARVTLGSGVTMAQVIARRELAFLHPVARAVGGPAVRNMATVGGNLFAPSPYGDFTVALLALDATVALQGGFAGRDTPLEEFLRDRDRHRGGALVASIRFNLPGNADGFRFRKVARVKPKGISVLSIGAQLPMSGGRINGARVAYGAMAPTPIRAKAVERALEGHALDEATIAAAVAVAAEGTSPPTDALASAWYRREVVAVHLKRLLLGTA